MDIYIHVDTILKAAHFNIQVGPKQNQNETGAKFLAIS